MATAQGDYQNPAYLERIAVSSPLIGGAATTTYIGFTPPSGVSAMRVRSASVLVTKVSTAAGTYTYYNGTTSIGKYTITSALAVGSIVNIADMNLTIAAGGTFGVVSGADAAGQEVIFFEAHVDPAATFSGNP